MMTDDNQQDDGDGLEPAAWFLKNHVGKWRLMRDGEAIPILEAMNEQGREEDARPLVSVADLIDRIESLEKVMMDGPTAGDSAGRNFDRGWDAVLELLKQELEALQQ